MENQGQGAGFDFGLVVFMGANPSFLGGLGGIGAVTQALGPPVQSSALCRITGGQESGGQEGSGEPFEVIDVGPVSARAARELDQRVVG
jgi:hypothetical protein